ncbi:MAG: phosphodiester glycosidase family protein [Desulfovibrio desulfuricans]|nr:phosphodiester glycosidase family protein [Desulfovibrio desulfuricans]
MTHRTDLYIAGQPAPAIAADRRDTGTGCARRWPCAARSFLANCLFICCLATFLQAAEAATVHSPARPGARPAIIPAAVTMDASTASIAGAANLSGEPTGNPQPPTPGVAAQTPSAAGVDELGKPAWRQLESGLDFGEFQLTDSEALLTALRIDPAHFDFILCARSQDGGNLRSLNQWAEQYGLTAAINASMYLPDGITSTGYMRQNGHHNNKRVVQRFGAFFVAGPDSPDLPGAAIVDRDDPQWEQRIGQYRLVIQNYRMTSADRRILWSPGGPHYSISAVAQDGDGHILFLHCRQPVEAYAFAQQLLHLPLNVRTVMYVEGGGQAGLLVRSADWKHELAGLSAAGLLVTGDLRAQLPNVLGAVRKTTAKDESATPPAADTPVDAPAATAPPARSESPDPAEEGQESPAPLPSPEESAGQNAPPQTENH